VLILAAPLSTGIASLATLLIDADNGLRAWWSIQRELSEARAELAALQAERDVLQEGVDALQSDPFELERRAREDGGMMLPGERVLRCCD